jgi:hypothetical protein
VFLTLQIDPDEVETLDNLKDLTGAESYEALLNEAIALATWAAAQSRNGRLVVSLDQARTGYKVLDMALLGHAAAAGGPAARPTRRMAVGE